VPPLGSVTLSGQQRAVPDLNKLPTSSLDPDWMREEGIRGYAINPISYKGEPLGAIVSATREPFQEELRPWGQIFADHVGAAIANARAFEEIQRLKAQLELHNTYLQEAMVEAKAFGDLVGQSAVLRQIVSQIDLVAPTGRQSVPAAARSFDHIPRSPPDQQLQGPWRRKPTPGPLASGKIQTTPVD